MIFIANTLLLKCFLHLFPDKGECCINRQTVDRKLTSVSDRTASRYVLATRTLYQVACRRFVCVAVPSNEPHYCMHCRRDTVNTRYSCSDYSYLDPDWTVVVRDSIRSYMFPTQPAFNVPRSLQSWVSTLQSVVLTADVFRCFCNNHIKYVIHKHHITNGT